MMLNSIIQKDVNEFNNHILKYSKADVIHNLFKT